jgi:hypothetical protein
MTAAEQRFTGAVGIASLEGKSIVVATRGAEVTLDVPGDEFTLSSEEAWCLAQQLLLAARRAGR